MTQRLVRSYSDDVPRQLRRRVGRPEKLLGFAALGIFDLLEVEEADAGAAPEDPVAVVLVPTDTSAAHSQSRHLLLYRRTYLFARDRILRQTHVRELCEALQRI